MRYGTGQNRFDTSDALDAAPPVDRLDAALDAAVDVLRDYGPSPGNTRIERMARWLAANVGGEPYCHEQAGSVERYTIGDASVYRLDAQFAVKIKSLLSTRDARAVAVALLRAAENAEREE